MIWIAELIERHHLMIPWPLETYAWRPHLESSIQTTGILFSPYNSPSTKLQIQLYLTLIRPHLTYCFAHLAPSPDQRHCVPQAHTKKSS